MKASVWVLGLYFGSIWFYFDYTWGLLGLQWLLSVWASVRPSSSVPQVHSLWPLTAAPAVQTMQSLHTTVHRHLLPGSLDLRLSLESVPRPRRSGPGHRPSTSGWWAEGPPPTCEVRGRFPAVVSGNIGDFQ
jgi:hypothetical protein